jgi:hypothetical protein
MKLASALQRVANENVNEEWTDNDWKFHVHLIPPPTLRKPCLLPVQSLYDLRKFDIAPTSLTIYLGSECAAFHPLWMRQNDITHVLTVMPESQIPTIAPLPLSGTRKVVPVLDVSSTPIQDHFSDIFRWMTHLPKDSKLLIHCQAGISRSVTLLASYFIRRYRMTYEETIHHMRQYRRQCGPNNGFVYQLRRLASFCTNIDSLPFDSRTSELILDYL